MATRKQLIDTTELESVIDEVKGDKDKSVAFGKALTMGVAVGILAAIPVQLLLQPLTLVDGEVFYGGRVLIPHTTSLVYILGASLTAILPIVYLVLAAIVYYRGVKRKHRYIAYNIDSNKLFVVFVKALKYEWRTRPWLVWTFEESKNRMILSRMGKKNAKILSSGTKKTELMRLKFNTNKKYIDMTFNQYDEYAIDTLNLIKTVCNKLAENQMPLRAWSRGTAHHVTNK